MGRILAVSATAICIFLVIGLAYAYLKLGRAGSDFENNVIVSEQSATSTMRLTLSSPVFENDASIPKEFTCDGSNTNPPLQVHGVPEGTGSLVLVMDDPDIPEAVKKSRGISKFNHWVLYNIPVNTEVIESGFALGTSGLNSAGKTSYTGPCPPREYTPTEHRYIFRLYAIKGTLNFIKAPTLDEVETAAQGNAIEMAEIVGRYDRTK